MDPNDNMDIGNTFATPTMQCHGNDYHNNGCSPSSTCSPISFITRKTRLKLKCEDTPNDSDTNMTDEKSQTKNENRIQHALISTPASSGNAPKRFRRDDRVNPFERQLLANLHRPVWSPSILQNSNSINQSPKQVETWAIDQISLLKPSNIEESPSTHQHEGVLTPQTEARAQFAISRFFSENVAPSPLILVEESGELGDKRKTANREAAVTYESRMVNTNLTFPPFLPPDIELLLASLSTAVPDPDGILNNSGRRKLDFKDDSTDDEQLQDGEQENSKFRPGGLIPSPGFDSYILSPCRFRDGMSPNMTPITGSPAISTSGREIIDTIDDDHL